MNAIASTDPASRRPGSSLARSVATASIFIALAVALGHLLAYVPNVELITFTVFASGVALGRWRGAAVGGAAMAIYSGLSPFGSGLAIPPLFAAQVAAAALTGFAGGATARVWSDPRRRGWPRVASGAALGFAITLIYQCAVIGGLAVAMPEFRTGVLAAIAANAFFSGVHLVVNTVVFSVLGPAVLPRLDRLAGSVARRAGVSELEREGGQR